jgi:hypothetical protein
LPLCISPGVLYIFLLSCTCICSGIGRGGASISGVWCHPRAYCRSKDRIGGAIYGEITRTIKVGQKIIGVTDTTSYTVASPFALGPRALVSTQILFITWYTEPIFSVRVFSLSL